MLEKINKPRLIRSFVRREGRMTTAQKLALTEHWATYGLSTVECTHSRDCSPLFARKAPCILEIGFGMGDSLFAQAKAHPEYNFIGIEVHTPGVGKLLQQAAAAKLNNLRVFAEDALEVLTKAIAPETLAEVWLFFPDPWPKKRHHKRRIVQPAFVELIQSKLEKDGKFHMATDWEEYALHMLTVLSTNTGFKNTAGAEQFVPRPELRPLTKFEKRGQALGHGVWDLIFIKI